MARDKVVLAYSGGLDTSVAVKWINETYGLDVIAYTCDLGQGQDIQAIRDKALRTGASVLVYPGGDLDAYRHTRRRDQVVFGPRTGFVRVAQTTGVPIVPIVAHGAHRSAYIFTEGHALARWLGLKRWGRLERFPLALALPWILAPGPWLPYLPLPFSIRLRPSKNAHKP